MSNNYFIKDRRKSLIGIIRQEILSLTFSILLLNMYLILITAEMTAIMATIVS